MLFLRPVRKGGKYLSGLQHESSNYKRLSLALIDGWIAQRLSVGKRGCQVFPAEGCQCVWKQIRFASIIIGH